MVVKISRLNFCACVYVFFFFSEISSFLDKNFPFLSHFLCYLYFGAFLSMRSQNKIFFSI